MVASRPRGVGPDGPAPEQLALNIASDPEERRSAEAEQSRSAGVSANFAVWFDLKASRLIIDAQVGSVGGQVPSVNVGGRNNSHNHGFVFNADWAMSLGQVTRVIQPCGGSSRSVQHGDFRLTTRNGISIGACPAAT